ncbi:DUF2971 domain-containing protein [Photobacterium swingsii]|uniref:DUF2971 domain-containing protein n=1 Tax=Photobacterium swingsii TaxID=680026 RepID=UPI00406829B1
MKRLENSYFKYSTLNQNMINSLLCNTLWHARVDTLNDPFELNFKFKADIPKDRNKLAELLEKVDYFVKPELRAEEKEAFMHGLISGMDHEINCALKDKVQEAENSLRTAIENQRYFICSLSGKYDEPLMWSHYANGMQGICIGYDKVKLHESDLKFEAVEYQPDIYEIDFVETYLKHKYEKDTYDFSPLLSISKVKHSRWEYELEVRSIRVPTSDERNRLGASENLQKNTIKSIIFGSKISSNDLDTLKHLAKHLNIPLFKASPDHNKFAVTIEPFNS